MNRAERKILTSETTASKPASKKRQWVSLYLQLLGRLMVVQSVGMELQGVVKSNEEPVSSGVVGSQEMRGEL